MKHRTSLGGKRRGTPWSAAGRRAKTSPFAPAVIRAALFLQAIVVCLVVTTDAVFARGDPARLCDRAAALAASQTGVPLAVLTAIMLVETGRSRGGALRPWPWTVNMEGSGHWFETEAAARAYTHEHFKRGARSFDVGCFQINYKWHHQAFASLKEMFEPEANALYAARFLKSLFAETADWHKAAGAYHSRTPQRAEVYARRFADLLDRNPGRPDPLARPSLPVDARVGSAPRPQSPAPAPRENTFPLLRASGPRALGSLVPLGPEARRPGLIPAENGG